MFLMRTQDSKREQDEAQPESTQSVEPAVEYKTWFMTCLKGHKHLQAHHFPVILSFFTSHGLTETEQASRYDAMLIRFGY